MENNDYNERVVVHLGRSLRAEGLVALAALATAVLVAALPIEAGWQLGALAWIGMSSSHALRALRHGAHLDLSRDGIVVVDGRRGVLAQGAFVAPWLAIVRWRPVGARFDRTRLVAPDMLAADDFRRLRILLEFGVRPLSPLFAGAERIKGTDHAT